MLIASTSVATLGVTATATGGSATSTQDSGLGNGLEDDRRLVTIDGGGLGVAPAPQASRAGAGAMAWVGNGAGGRGGGRGGKCGGRAGRASDPASAPAAQLMQPSQMTTLFFSVTLPVPLLPRPQSALKSAPAVSGAAERGLDETHTAWRRRRCRRVRHTEL